MNDFAEGLLHVPRLVDLVVGERGVEAQHRDAVGVDHEGIDLAVGVGIFLIRAKLTAAWPFRAANA